MRPTRLDCIAQQEKKEEEGDERHNTVRGVVARRQGGALG
jgi:hypothetical protein